VRREVELARGHARSCLAGSSTEVLLSSCHLRTCQDNVVHVFCPCVLRRPYI
jgi:hypothetical protein